MRITDKDELRVGDDARFHHGKSVMGGPVLALTQGADGGPIISVTVEGFEQSITVHDHVARGGWLWEFDGAERPDPKIPFAAVGTATVDGFEGMRVMRTDGTGGADTLWVTPNLVGGTRTHGAHAVRDFQPDPDYRNAVDAYARQIQALRVFAESLAEHSSLRHQLLWILDAAPEQSKPTLSHRRLAGTLRQAVDHINAGATTYDSQPEFLARAVEILLKKDLGIEVAS